MRRRLAAPAAVVLLVLSLGACSDDGGSEGDGGPTDSPSSGSTDPGAPTKVTAERNLLDWQNLEMGENTLVAGDRWHLSVPDDGSAATLTGPDDEIVVEAGRGRKIVEAFLGAKHALVVAQDDAEQKPQVATLVDLTSGKRQALDDPPTGPNGPWAFDGDTAAWATWQPGSDYCLATRDLSEKAGEKGYCAPPRHGFTRLNLSPSGLTMMTFDDRRPVSCRTLVTVDGTEVTPIDGVPKCKGWEAVATPDGAVWSTIPKEQQIELGAFHASADGQQYDLGSGDAGSLTWCGDSAYFTRAVSQRGGAQVLRWTPDRTLEIVYQSPGKGEAFLTPPACAGNRLTVTTYGQGGDERVVAEVPH